MGIILTVTDEDQVILDKDMLRRLGVHVGDQLTIEARPAPAPAPTDRPGKPISSLFGMLADKTGPSLTIEEIREEAKAGWAGER